MPTARKKIILLGSPAEVCVVLDELLSLVKSNFIDLLGVISQPAKPVGRKKQLSDPPLAAYAKSLNIPCWQPDKASSKEFMSQLKNLEPDILITAAYGQILSQEFLNIPKRATINIHPSKLPRYRGATPIQSALMDGLSQTAVSILFTTRKLDSGAIILQENLPIQRTDNSETLLNKAFTLGARLLTNAITKLNDPNFVGSEQLEQDATHCKKLSKEMGFIDWNMTAKSIYQLYQGLYQWPQIRTQLNQNIVILTEVSDYLEDSNLDPNEAHFDTNTKLLHIGCGEHSALLVKRVKPAGSNEIQASDFWNSIKQKTSGKVYFEKLR